jgi:hypothetical protein
MFVFKLWMSLFDTGKECLDVVPIWVCLPCLPLEFWSKGDFQNDWELPWHFLGCKHVFFGVNECVVVCILVHINLREGLMEDIEMVSGG